MSVYITTPPYLQTRRSPENSELRSIPSREKKRREAKRRRADMRRNTLLALVSWLMLLAFFVATATASLPCQCCWIVEQPTRTCGHACCGDNCCPPPPPYAP